MKKKKGLRHLVEEVQRKNLCCSCGACVNICPYILSIDDRVAAIEYCDLEEGRCYNYCPITEIDYSKINEYLFKESESKNGSIGCFKEIVRARGKKFVEDRRIQYGGVATSLIIHLLDKGGIDGAILTKSDGLESYPVTVTTAEEVIACAGSKYSLSPTIAEVNSAIRKGFSRLAVVALPCQVLALRKMQLYEPEDETKRFKGVEYIIGLFCTWALSQIGFRKLLKDIFPERDIVKMDIPPPPSNVLKVFLKNSGNEEIILDEVKRNLKNSCNYCLDMTAEFADISIGTVEGMDGWNTVIIRTEKGEKIFKDALNDNYIEKEILDEGRMSHLRDASENKRKRALERINE